MVKADFFVVELWWRLLECPFTVSVCFAACMKDANPFLFFLFVGRGKSARWKACSFLIWNPWAESGLLSSEDYKLFGRGKKIIRLKMKNRLAENGKSFGADFFCCFPQRRGTVRQWYEPRKLDKKLSGFYYVYTKKETKIITWLAVLYAYVGRWHIL